MANIIRRRGESPEGAARPLTRRGWDPFQTMRELLRWEPLQEMGGLPGYLPSAHERGFAPAFDVRETPDSYVFKADVPGLRENDLDISISGNRVTLSGKREEEEAKEGETWYVYERSLGTFARSFTLPEGVETQNIKAE